MADYHDFDVIVIGAGPGGLTAAAHLANAGRRVLVIEAGDHVGGHMWPFTHAGYEFDVGLHCTSEAPAQRVLRPLGVEVEFRQFDPLGRFRILGPQRQFAVPRGMVAYRERLLEAFPGERGAIEDFLTLVQRLVSAQQQIPDAPGLRDLPMLPWRLRDLARHARSTAGGYLDSVGASPGLQTALLGWTNGSVAMAPSRLSLLAAAALITDYVEDLCYPQGGSQVISAGLADVVRRHGGEVMLGTEVDRILVTRGRTRGVQVRSASVESAPQPAREIRAPAVVSAVSVQQTYLQLVDPAAVTSRLRRRVTGYEMPLPLAVVYLVLDRDLAAEGHPNAIDVVHDTDDLDTAYATLRAGDLPEAGFVMVWIANLADPGNPRLCPVGQTNVQLMGVVPAQHIWWGIVPGRGPTPRYEARKRQVRDQFVRLAERSIPGMGEAIVHEETATPITSERFMRCPGGTSFGPAFTPRQAFTRIGPTSPIAGLFHAGASAQPAHGLGGTLPGGVAAASAVTRIPVEELLTQP